MAKTSLSNNLDVWFSRYIRLRDCDAKGFFVCISCGRTMPYEQADCGHYINRSIQALRYSEINCNAQCRHCNRFIEGNMSGYRNGLVKKYGEQRVLLLEMQKNEKKKWSKFEQMALLDYYKDMVKGLRLSKPLLKI